jgi:hypothetical protein
MGEMRKAEEKHKIGCQLKRACFKYYQGSQGSHFDRDCQKDLRVTVTLTLLPNVIMMLRKLRAAESTHATASISVRAQALVFRIKVEFLRLREDHCNDDLALFLRSLSQAERHVQTAT